MTSGFTLRRYMVLTTDATTTTIKKSHPLDHAHVPAGRNRQRTRISKDAVVLMIRRRRSIGSGCGCWSLLAAISLTSSDTTDPSQVIPASGTPPRQDHRS